MLITIKLWGNFRKFLPKGSEGYAAEIEVPDNSSAREIAELSSVPFDECRILILNGITHTVPEDWAGIRVNDGDTVAILPNIH